MKFSAGGGALGFSPFVVCSGEESFEGSPSFMLNRQTFKGFAVVYKKTSMIYKLKSDAKDLFYAVWGVAGGSVISAVFYSAEESFNWLIDVIWCSKDSVVFL